MLRALPDGTVNVSVWNKLYTRELWEGIRFLEGHVFEDWEATYKIMNRIGKAVVIGDALYLHRKRPGSITQTLSWRNICDHILLAFRIDAYIRENLSDCFTEEQIRAAGQVRLHSLMGAFVCVFPEDTRVVGVIVATILTTLLICDTVEPYVVFRHVFGESPRKFCLRNYSYIALFTACLALLSRITRPSADVVSGFLVNGLISVGVSAAALGLLMLFDRRFRAELRTLVHALRPPLHFR